MTAKKLKWERKAEERPGELLQAALSVFSRKGYRATPLEVVAEEAGVSKGTIYRYFQNKEDLLEKALETRVRQSMEEAAEALQDFEGTPSGKLRFMLERFWTRSQNPEWGVFLKLMFSEIAYELPALFRKWLQSGTFQAWKMIEEIIRQGQEDGSFRKDADAEGISRYVLSGLSYQAYLLAHVGPKASNALPPDRVFESACGLIFAGLENRETFEGKEGKEEKAKKEKKEKKS